MSLATISNRNDYVGNNSTDTYDYTYRILAESDLVVVVRDTDDVETTLTLNDDYTVTGVGDEDGGTIVLSDGNLATDYVLSIFRRRPLTQETDIRNQGSFYPEVHEDVFDHLVMISQQQQDLLSRSIRLSDTVAPDDFDTALPSDIQERAGEMLVVNDAGDGFAFIPITSEDIIDLALGASGVAGSLELFPTTANKGKIRLTATNNNANYTINITNAAVAADRTYTIPEAGSNASFVMTAGTYTMAGTYTFPNIVTLRNGSSGTDLALQFAVSNTGFWRTGSGSIAVVVDGDLKFGFNADTIGTTVPLQIGEVPSTQTPTPNLLVSVAVAGADINFDNIRDLSTVTPTNNGTLFCSYDTSIIAGGTHNYGHLAGYQDRIQFTSSGTLDFQWGFYSQPTFDGGAVGNRWAIRIRDPLGAGSITNNVALYIEDMTRGSSNYGVYQIGTNCSNAFQGLVHMSYPGNPIKGVIDGSSTVAGYIGEVISSTVGVTALPTSTEYGDLTSITLTAGHWLISCHIDFNLNTGTALTNVSGGIGTTTGNSSAGLTTGDTSLFQAPPTADTDTSISIVNRERKITGSTTYYLKMRGVYSGGTPRASGSISALRIR